jgi:hypothetical protein
MAVRKLVKEPKAVCEAIGVDERFADFLVSEYLRDLDAVTRSSRTQLVGDDGPISPVNLVSLTGRTQFEDVAQTLDSLQVQDERRSFEDRIHVITASSMMSHGVDVDRLNVMIVLGLPLTTAEFIQATSRVGRKWPALVLVVHKMGRERDAGVFRLSRWNGKFCYVARGKDWDRLCPGLRLFHKRIYQLRSDACSICTQRSGCIRG